MDSDLFSFDSLNERQAINYMNCAFMEAGEVFNVDVQYEGYQETRLPQLVPSLDEASKQAQTDSAMSFALGEYYSATKNKLDKSGYKYYRGDILYRDREKETFFSPSLYATKDQPYGPYVDHLCTPDDPATTLTVRLTKSFSSRE